MRIVTTKRLLSLLLICGLSGCGSKRSQLPDNDPLIGIEALASQEGRSGYSVQIPICNRGSEELKGKVYISGKKDELLGGGISAFSAPEGSYHWITLANVKEKRTHPVFVRIDWEHGKEKGTKRFVISPKQTNEIEVVPHK